MKSCLWSHLDIILETKIQFSKIICKNGEESKTFLMTWKAFLTVV